MACILSVRFIVLDPVMKNTDENSGEGFSDFVEIAEGDTRLVKLTVVNGFAYPRVDQCSDARGRGIFKDPG